MQVKVTRPAAARLLSTSLAVLAGVAALSSADTRGAIPNPTVTGPIAATAAPGDPSRNYSFLSTALFPFGSGYVEEEFFIEGTASRYTIDCTSRTSCPLVSTTAPATVLTSGHPYKIRMVVRRPSDPAKFSGNVAVEWQNVTNNWELDVQWYRAADYFIRKGWAWVGVGPQRAGIHGTPNGLRAWNPARYGTLDVTAGGTINDDTLKWDIFSQAGQAIANPRGVDPLGGLPGTRTLIATGDSQSSSNLAQYLNTVHPLDPIYPGFVLGGPLGIPIRDVVTSKVLKVISEWDLIGANEVLTRQPDTNRRVSWEVAGSSHSDYHNFVVNAPVRYRDVGITGILPDTTNCVDPARSRANLYLVYHAAYDWMVRWVQNGQQPPSMVEPLIVDYTANPIAIGRDAFGIAHGGIRLPDVTVPAALNNGWNTGGKGGTTATACQQAGTYVPFDQARLRSLYTSHADYVAKVAAAAERNVQQGFLLAEDAQRIVAEAEASDVLAAPGADGSIRIVEYYRIPSAQYFLASDVNERASLEAGGSGGAWVRTGNSFFGWVTQGAAPADAVPVWRFYGAPGRGPTSHFFTASAAERSTILASGNWIDEGTAFRAGSLTAGECSGTKVPVVRMWKPGATTAASRHRYVIGVDKVAELRAAGWTFEGPVFCAAL